MTVIVPCSCMTVPSTYVSTHSQYSVAASIITGSVSSMSIFITLLVTPRAIELTMSLSFSLSLSRLLWSLLAM